MSRHVTPDAPTPANATRVRRFSLRRLALLVGVLGAEVWLTASLWYSGWFGTGSRLQLLASLAAALLPLAVAGILIFRKRFRFGLRSLLAAMALVAVFMFASVRPLLEAREARTASRVLRSNGVITHLHWPNNSFYQGLGYDVPVNDRPDLNDGEIPGWLKPIAGDLNDHSPDWAIAAVQLRNDAEALAFCDVASLLERLQSVDIAGVSSRGMELLRRRLPELPQLISVSVNNNTDIPEGWLSALTNVRCLWVWAEGPRMGSPLASGQLRAIAALPRLEVLVVFGYDVNDANVQALAASRSLKHLVLRHSNVSLEGARRLSKAMPWCRIRSD